MGIIRDMQRVHATQAHAEQRAQAAVVRQRDQIRRNADLAIAAAQQATAAADERERRRLYAEARDAEVAAANAALRSQLDELDTLLLSTLEVDDHIDLDRFKKPVQVPPFDPGPLGRPLPEPAWQSFAPPEPRGVGRVLGGEARHRQQVAAARQAYEQALARHAEAEQRRRRQLDERQRRYQDNHRKLSARVAAYNAEVDRFAAAVAAADPAAVIEYFGMVLGNSVYPDGFPQKYRLAYLPGERHLVVEYHLPPVEVVPAVREHRYDRATDTVRARGRSAEEVRSRYRQVLAQVTLRTVHEIVEADRGRLVELVLFNGIVDTVDRRTGRAVRPCLVSVRVLRDAFAAIRLRHVDPVACLEHLDARVSTTPDELTGVRALLDFDRVDSSFSETVDVLADLDHRPNLAALPATDFEDVLTDLFTVLGVQMGPPVDEGDGTEWISVDPRPLFGGTVVVHARRAEHLDATAVQQLVDTVERVGATKGFLVTTGGFDPAAYQVADGQPVELIDGATLLGLVARHSRLHARIDHHPAP
jgi:restriction system protein